MPYKFYKEIIQSNIAGLNPTGTIDFNGTFQMNGNNNIVLTSSQTSKINLNKVKNNEVVCSNIEKFENYNINKINKFNKNNIYLILLISIILILFLYYILYKKKS